MNKKVKILLALGAVLLLVLAAAYLKGQDRDESGKQNSIASIESAVGDKTFQSKLSAWDAYANEKEQYYKRSAHSFRPSPETDAAEYPQNAVADENTQTEAIRPTMPRSGNPARQQDDGSFDAAYEEVARNIDQIYEDPKSRPTAHTLSQEPPVKEDAAAQRREAMMRDWGMTGSMEPAANASGGMFRAVIHGTQTIKSGQTALFRTKEEIHYGNMVVPANTLLTGWTSISENRLTITISSVRLGHEVYALPLEVYGSDGMKGLPLNYDAAGKIANTQASATATQEISSAASRYGGTIGRVAGTLISGVGSQVRSIKNVEVKLIDNQSVILKIAEQK